jgi:hypothetical protein
MKISLFVKQVYRRPYCYDPVLRLLVFLSVENTKSNSNRVREIYFEATKCTDLPQDCGNCDGFVADCSLMNTLMNNYTGLTTTSC